MIICDILFCLFFFFFLYLVTIKVQSRRVWVEGPRGKLTKDFRHAQVTIKKIKATNTILVEKRFDKKKRCAVVKTITGHIKNMIIGVTKGFRYKMKLVYAHFPINATIVESGKGIEIRNYIGQKDTRRIKMIDGVTIKDGAQKDELYLEGNDLEDVSHSGMIFIYLSFYIIIEFLIIVMYCVKLLRMYFTIE